MKFNTIRGSFICVLIAVVPGSSLLNAANESLILRPPFQAPAVSASTPVVNNVPTSGSINQKYQLAGVFDDGQNMRVSIHEKQQNGKSFWLSVGETQDGLSVESYDRESRGVVVSMGGKQELLKLRESNVNTSAVGRPRVYQPAGGNTNLNFPKTPPPPPEASKLLEQLRKRNK